jgi:hypothetical protein
MAAQKLDKAEWAAFLAGLTKALEGAEAEIEVESLEIGDQVEANWLPLFGTVVWAVSSASKSSPATAPSKSCSSGSP